MLTIIGENLPLILGFAVSMITAVLAYLKSVSADNKTKDAFLFGSINRVVELLQSDNETLRKRIVQLEERIVQLEGRITSLVARAENS